MKWLQKFDFYYFCNGVHFQKFHYLTIKSPFFPENGYSQQSPLRMNINLIDNATGTFKISTVSSSSCYFKQCL